MDANNIQDDCRTEVRRFRWGVAKLVKARGFDPRIPRFDKFAGSEFEQWSVCDTGPKGVEGRTPGIILAQTIFRMRTEMEVEDFIGV